MPKLFSDALVAGRSSTTLKGEFTTDDALAILLKGTDLDLSVALLDASYVRYQPRIGINYADRDLDYSPSQVIVAGYTRTFPLASGAKIAARAESRYSAAYYATDFNTPAQFSQPSYTRSNATVTYSAEDDRWYLEAFIKNIEDEIVFSGYQSGRIYVSEPRLYGMRAGVRF